MPIDFFKSENSRILNRFNQTFGTATIQDQTTRCQVMLAMIHLGRLEKQIENEPDQTRNQQEGSDVPETNENDEQ